MKPEIIDVALVKLFALARFKIDTINTIYSLEKNRSNDNIIELEYNFISSLTDGIDPTQLDELINNFCDEYNKLIKKLILFIDKIDKDF